MILVCKALDKAEPCENCKGSHERSPQAENNECMSLTQDAKQKAWHRVLKDWDQGERKWEVELDGLQICLQASEQAGGRFMLAADKASLGGRLLQTQQLTAIHLDVDKVNVPCRQFRAAS